MPHSISTKLGNIHIDNKKIQDRFIRDAVLIGNGLNDAIIAVLTPQDETWNIYIHVYDKAIPSLAILTARLDISVPNNWWDPTADD